MNLRCILTLAAVCVLSALPAALGQPGPGQNVPVVGETSKAESPPFVASLVLVKADWSKVPAAKEIEAELRAALKDAAIPQDKLAELPASGAQIFFAPELVAHYKAEEWAEFAAWLAAKGLLEKIEAFPVVKAHVVEGQPGGAAPKYYTLLRKSHEFVEVPWSPQLFDQPFITRRPQFYWELDYQEGKHFVALRELVVVEQSRGETEPTKRESLETANWEFDLAPGQAAVMNAFPGRGDRDLRASARGKGFEAVLVVSRPIAPAEKKFLTPRLHLPQSVKPLEVVSRSSFLSRGGSRGVPRTGTGSLMGSGSSSSGSSGRPGRGAPASSSIKVFQLVNAKAASVAKIIGQLFPGEPISLAVDERTNSIIASGTEETLAPIEALLVRLDQPAEGSTKTPPPPVKLVPSEGSTPADRYRTAEAEAAAVARGLGDMLADPKRSEARVAELRALLRKKVAASFAARQELLKHDLAELQERMRALGETIESRGRIADEVIDRRVQELLNPASRWDSGAARNVPPSSSNGDPLDTTTSLAPAPLSKAISDSVAPTAIWDDLGLKLEVVSAKELAHPALHGGLRIVELRPDGPAEWEGLRKGDILLGLGVWETLSHDNALYALFNAPTKDGGATGRPRHLKFYVLREGKALNGEFKLKALSGN